MIGEIPWITKHGIFLSLTPVESMNKFFCFLLLFICGFVLGDPPASILDRSGTVLAPTSEPFNNDISGTCNPGEHELVYLLYPETTSFSVRANDALVFDLVSPYDSSPTFSISFTRCVLSTPTQVTCEQSTNMGSGLISLLPGNSISGDFKLSFVLNPAGIFTYTPLPQPLVTFFGIIIEFDSTGNTLPLMDHFDTSNNAIYFNDICGNHDSPIPILQIQLFGNSNPPGFRIVNCPSYRPLGCVPQSPIQDTPTDPGICSAQIALADADDIDLQDESGRGVCPLIFTRNPAASPSVFSEGSNTVSYNFQNQFDSSINANCGEAFDVIDMEPPTVTCPQGFNTQVDNMCAASFTLPDTPISDNCPGATLVQIPDAPLTDVTVTIGTYDYTATVTDAAGLQDSCGFRITVFDLNPPTFPNCPMSDITLDNIPGTCSATIDLTNEVTVVVDDCPITNEFTNYPPVGHLFPVGRTEYLARATDSSDLSGRCSFFVIVSDTEAPVIQCPADINVSVSGPTPIFYNTNAYDNCPSSIVGRTSCDFPSGTRFPVASTDVTCTVSDGVQTDSCIFVITLTQRAPGTTPSQTPIFLPSQSRTNSPSQTSARSPAASRDQVTPSTSNTPSRSTNPSITATVTPTRTPPNTPSPTPSRTSSPSSTASRSRSQTRTPSLTPIRLSLSVSRSAVIPSQSATTTPEVVIIPFVQEGLNTLVELIIPCKSSTCTSPEIQFYLDAFAIELEIPDTNVILQSSFGHEITFIVCNSPDTADLLNQINFSTTPPPSLANTFVENAVFNVACPNRNIVLETTAAASTTSALASLCFSVLLLIT